MKELAERCVRKRVELFGENYYITVGKVFVSPTVPYENSPQMSREREIIETICEVVSETLVELNQK
jgi:hypothetical protein